MLPAEDNKASCMFQAGVKLVHVDRVRQRYSLFLCGQWAGSSLFVKNAFHEFKYFIVFKNDSQKDNVKGTVEIRLWKSDNNVSVS